LKFLEYLKWIVTGQAAVFFRLSRNIAGCYTTCFLSRAGRTGVLAALAPAPLALRELRDTLKLPPEQEPGLEAFLHLGMTLGEIGLRDDRYHLKGRLARALSKGNFDPFLALAEEAAGLHVPYINAALKEGDASSLVELTAIHSEIIARSSKVIEPILRDVVERLIPRSGPFELLEIGSGSGVYLFHALALNPALSATGVERVVTIARDLEGRISGAGLASRAKILASDVRSLEYRDRFDCITLFNNIYYFPEAEHRDLLAGLCKWLKPGGRLAVATLCRDGKYPIDAVMHMWSAMTPGASRLVEAGEFRGLMEAAGFVTEVTTPSAIDPAMKVFIGRKRVEASVVVGDRVIERRKK